MGAKMRVRVTLEALCTIEATINWLESLVGVSDVPAQIILACMQGCRKLMAGSEKLFVLQVIQLIHQLGAAAPSLLLQRLLLRSSLVLIRQASGELMASVETGVSGLQIETLPIDVKERISMKIAQSHVMLHVPRYLQQAAVVAAAVAVATGWQLALICLRVGG